MPEDQPDPKSKPRLVFVDHSFHQKTKSSYFFVEVLERDFEVIRIWDEAWSGGTETKAEAINAQNPDAVVFWQAIISDGEIGKLKAPATWVPMYDQSKGLAYGSGAATSVRKSGLKVMAWCRRIEKNLKQHGVEVLPLEYYPAPEVDQPMDFETPKVFLWQRADIGFDHLKAMFSHWPDASFVVKIDPDPEFEPTVITPEDHNNFEVEVIHGFLDKEVYDNLVGTCNIYVAPRTAEGIGLSFLEAMAKGMVVVSPDRPTMNEYYMHLDTGYLFDPKNPQPLPIENLPQIAKNSLEKLKAGHDRWNEQTKHIADFVRKPAPYKFEGVSPVLKLKILADKVNRRIASKLGKDWESSKKAIK